MLIIALLVGVSVCIAGGFLIAFILSVKGGQFEDTYTPSIRILLESEKESENQK